MVKKVIRQTLGPRSTLRNHTFPPFYACYLLRSLKSGRSRATYIGSTPHPPRRIRQHNGELAAGARKTMQGRPWDMCLNVYGFPSKLAALQFEWAWQHPHISRHLKSEEARSTYASTTLKNRIGVLRTMIGTSPYNNWPLRMKMYSKEALMIWEQLKSDGTPLPRGFGYTVELEGVDGKNEHAGSGRTGPIDVTDSAFTSEHLAKFNEVRRTKNITPCTTCAEPISVSHENALDYTLCVHSNCTSISHLSCLAATFLKTSADSEGTALNKPGIVKSLVPRGGDCPSCGEWTLWGDLVKGCYRRQAGAIAKVAKEAKELSEDDDAEEVGSHDEDGTLRMDQLSLAEGSNDDGSTKADSTPEVPVIKKRAPRKKKPKYSSTPPAKAKLPGGSVVSPSRPRGRPRKVHATTSKAVHTLAKAWESSADEWEESDDVVEIERLLFWGRQCA